MYRILSEYEIGEEGDGFGILIQQENENPEEEGKLCEGVVSNAVIGLEAFGFGMLEGLISVADKDGILMNLKGGVVEEKGSSEFVEEFLLFLLVLEFLKCRG